MIDFGPFRYDPESRFLYRDNEEIPLPPRVLSVLESLLQRAGKVVPKEELLASAWEGAFVGEDSLTQAISQLRQALGDDPQHPIYIQTVPRRGYRFVGEVSNSGQKHPAAEQGPGASPAEAAAHAEHRPSSRVVWVAGAVLILISAVWYLSSTTTSVPSPADEPLPATFEINLPGGTDFGGRWPNFGISPDGKLIAFVAQQSDSERTVYLQRLGELVASPLVDTRGVQTLLFSPQGDRLAFEADGKLWQINIDGTGRTSVCDLQGDGIRGAQWLEERDTILVGSAITAPIRTCSLGVSESTEDLTRLTAGDNWGHRLPVLLPGGRFLLFHGFPGYPDDRTAEGVWVADLTDDETPSRRLIEHGFDPRYVPTGHLVWTDSQSRRLMVDGFDPETLVRAGTPRPLEHDIRVGLWGGASFAFSDEGTMVYRPTQAVAEADLELVVDQPGSERRLGRSGVEHSQPRVSPDGRRVAFIRGADLWLVDLARPEIEDLVLEDVSSAVWEPPDGDTLLVSSASSEQVFRVNADGSGDPVALFRGDNIALTSVRSDGAVLYRDDNVEAGFSVFLVPGNQFDGSDPRYRTAAPLVSSPGGSWSATFSPDGDWIAFEWRRPEERWQVYVKTSNSDARPVPVSNEGGRHPTWSFDGSRIFYRDLDGALQAASFAQDTGRPEVGQPEPLFERDYVRGGLVRQYDVLPGGGFLFLRPLGSSEPPRLTVVRNWFEELERLVPTER